MTKRGNRLTSDSLFTLLSHAPCGVYAVTVDQNVVFWNHGAERILGFPTQEVIGRKCYEIGALPLHHGLTEQCAEGCSLIRYLWAGMVPAPTRVRMLCADGNYKWVVVNPMVVTGVVEDSPLLVHFFDHLADDNVQNNSRSDTMAKLLGQSTDVAGESLTPSSAAPERSGLTTRELQVLRLMADGKDNYEISDHLEISLYTVRNHVRNVRQKLNAGTKLEAVVNAVRMGLLTLD